MNYILELINKLPGVLEYSLSEEYEGYNYIIFYSFIIILSIKTITLLLVSFFSSEVKYLKSKIQLFICGTITNTICCTLTLLVLFYHPILFMAGGSIILIIDLVTTIILNVEKPLNIFSENIYQYLLKKEKIKKQKNQYWEVYNNQLKQIL